MVTGAKAYPHHDFYSVPGAKAYRLIQKSDDGDGDGADDDGDDDDDDGDADDDNGDDGSYLPWCLLHIPSTDPDVMEQMHTW